MSSLSGKTVLVTGASRGIGKALKSVCGAQGALIIPHASQPSANTDDSFIYEDLSLKGAGGRVFEAALEKYGRIDGVVNNAGVFLPSPLEAAGWDAEPQKSCRGHSAGPSRAARGGSANGRILTQRRMSICRWRNSGYKWGKLCALKRVYFCFQA